MTTTTMTMTMTMPSVAPAVQEKDKQAVHPSRKLSSHMTNALSIQNRSMFKEPSGMPCPYWPVTIVQPVNFTFQQLEAASLPPILGKQSFEYTSSWIEHYYHALIQTCPESMITMLYQWYGAQFVIDYISDVYPLTVEQYLDAADLLDQAAKLLPNTKRVHVSISADGLQGDKNEVAPQGIADSAAAAAAASSPLDSIKDAKIRSMLLACRKAMHTYHRMVRSLPSTNADSIDQACHGFYRTVVQQYAAVSQEKLFASMSLEEYYDFRSQNAGGEMGFLRQTYLFALIEEDDTTSAKPGDDVLRLARIVGKNIAVMNDLYGLEKDIATGDVNVILKYQDETACSTSEAIEWAKREIHATVHQVNQYSKANPDTLESKYGIAMSCISGNHGTHDTSKRFGLPDGFVWDLS